MPAFSTVFSSWYRFSHGSNGLFPSAPSELTTWTYNAATDSIRNTTNSSTFIGMVSNETVGDYEFDMKVSSTDSDDDWIGLVLGFYKDPITGKEYTLSALRGLNGGAVNKAPTFSLVYNFGQTGSWVISSQGPVIDKGWNTAGVARLRAVREGNMLSVYSYVLSSIDATQPLQNSYVLDLTSDPRLAVFLGETKYGYGALSQTASTWAPIKRPDADGTAKYGSMEAVRQVAMAADNLLLATGTIADGATIPTPAGYTTANLKCVVVPYTLDTDTSGIKSYTCDVDSALKVRFNATTQNGVTYSGVAKYFLYGVM